MAITEFSAALKQVCSERGLSEEAVLDTIKTAIVAAYMRDFGGTEETITAAVDGLTGELRVYNAGEDVTPAGFGRIAAQTAKQVILQKIRESEKEAIIKEYTGKIGTIASGHVFRLERGLAVINLGKVQGLMPGAEQIPTENLQLNLRTRVLIKEIREGARGPEIIVSRSDPKFVKELFALEVPEIASDTVKIEAISREPGSRTKIAVSSTEENVDPIGSCVGQKGTRVQAVIAELGTEKIDIVAYNDNTDKFIAASLSPAKVLDVILNKSAKEARVLVPEDQLSLAIGKEGQNVRLAAKLTGWKIDIKTPAQSAEMSKPIESISKSDTGGSLKDAGLSTRTVSSLKAAGITSLEELKAKTLDEVKELKGVGPKAITEIAKLYE
ncbi:MAG: transcription termination factor NusA [candidate division WWE3 bacterium]|nr:transcription termination factor NusA [candidate division WWE3 bacterium]